MSVAVRTPEATAEGAPPLERAAPAQRLKLSADAYAIAGLTLLFALLAGLSWQKWGVPSVDPGHELTTAATVAEGGTPYLDIRYFYGPVGVYALGGAFAVFGTSFTTAFAFGLLQAAAIIAAFYALARRLLSVVPAAIATAMVAGIGFSGTALNFVLPHTNSATLGILFLLLMLLALSREQLVMAGLAGGIVCLNRPEFAAVAALTGAAYIAGIARDSGWRPALRAIPPLALPAIAVAGLVLGVLAADVGTHNLFFENLWPVDFLRIAGFDSQKAWAPMDLESVVATLVRAGTYCLALAAVLSSAVMLSRARSTGERLRALWPLPAALLLLAFFYGAWKAVGIWDPARSEVQYEMTHLLIGMSWLPALGFAACALLAVCLLRGEKAPISGSWAFDLALVAAAAALGARAYDAFTAEASYAPYYAPPLVLLLALLHDRLGKRRPEARAASYGFLAAVAVGLIAYAQIGLYRDDSATVHTPRGSFVTTPAAAPALQGTIDYIDSHTAPGEPIVAIPLDSGLHFMTGRPPALYNAMFLPGLLDSRADELEAIEQLKQEHVRYAVIDQRRFTGYRFERFGVDYNQLFGHWLTRSGAPVATFGGPPRVGGTNPSNFYTVYRIDP
jgi:hypothetical protein